MLDPMTALTAVSVAASAGAFGKAAKAAGDLVRLCRVPATASLGAALENGLSRPDDADLPADMAAMLDKLD